MVRRLNFSPIKILDYCQMVFVGVQVNFKNILYLLTSVRPSSSIFTMDCLYPSIKQSYCELNVSGHGYGSIQALATCDQIIIVNKNFIDNPILSPILGV